MRIAAASPRLCALGFGAEDYAAAIGLAPAPSSLGVSAQMVGVAAHAHGQAFWGLAGSVAETVDMEAFGALERLAAAARAAMSTPEIGRALEAIAFVPVTDSTPESATRFIAEEAALWGPVIRAANIEIE